MPIATSNQKDVVIAVLKDAFQDNPSVQNIINGKRSEERQLELLLLYAYERAVRRGGVFISENEKSVALCFSSVKNVFSFREMLAELKFGMAVSLIKSFKTLIRQKRLAHYRVKEPHLFFWFFGAVKGNEKASYELMKEIFSNSAEMKLPIVAETSVEKNKRVYERFGFEVYHTFDDGEGPILWMMKREPI